ncbi:MAG: hypothetical protein ONB16_07275 [candidate division KSB1 bacterium]|nr:hypothetical protein [candidate division KSB1 bacterium]MDZ7319469.1 hypothetical protein [candidate division KSB1 bacterium]MDZ7342418.1 hypothetical protein [candidate division KSB1 bacterium]
MPTESAAQALKILRDGSMFQWYVIPLFAFVVYVYAAEIEKKNWSLVFAGLTFWGLDWFNEIWNGLVFHFTQYAPVWGTPGKSAFVILIGLNIEICFMFAIAGIAFSKMLPTDKKLKILGLPNRLFFAIAGSIFCVFVEVLLNAVGALTWDYSWWNARAPWLIFLLGYFYFFIGSFWVFDMTSRKKQATVVGIIFGFDILCLILFGAILKWI